MQRRIIAKSECDLVADYVRRKGMSIIAMELARAVVDSRSEVIGGSRTRGVRDRLSAALDAPTLEGRLKPIQARAVGLMEETRCFYLLPCCSA